MWRNHKATTLATPEAFERDPGLVVSDCLFKFYDLAEKFLLETIFCFLEKK
jgi:hypothetical protein